MDLAEFNKLKAQFEAADVEEKITLYVNTEGLSADQYRELLRSFPIHEINRLEAALK